mgnify:CR=1 FL=1
MAIPVEDRQRILAIAREVQTHVRNVGGKGRYCSEGLCGEAALALSVRLTRAGIPHKIIGGSWQGPIDIGSGTHVKRLKEAHEDPNAEKRLHAWIEFPQYDNAVLDVTGDQYGSFVPDVWFPARREYYEPLEAFDAEQIFSAARALGEGLGKPDIPLAGPRFRRPVQRAKVRVRNHLRHPPRSCLCHRFKSVDRARKTMVRRLR